MKKTQRAPDTNWPGVLLQHIALLERVLYKCIVETPAIHMSATTQIGPRGTAHEVISSQRTDMVRTAAAMESIWGPSAKKGKDDADSFQKISRRHMTNPPLKPKTQPRPQAQREPANAKPKKAQALP